MTQNHLRRTRDSRVTMNSGLLWTPDIHIHLVRYPRLLVAQLSSININYILK